MSKKTEKESSALVFLYRTVVGRVLLKALTARWVSKAAGKFLDSGLSKPLIKHFVRKNGIELSDYYSDGFTCFNDCFTRKIKDGVRSIDMDPSSLISPCDGLLSVYRITPDTELYIKGSQYCIEELVENPELARRYSGGLCLVFRLCVNNYHRYIYIDSGTKGKNTFIPGVLHTVRPIALGSEPVFKRNCREYTVMNTENFAAVTQIEVGALLVGKIKNHDGESSIERGQEKGMFLYGGSTIILLLEKDAAEVDGELFEATEKNIETPVLMGQKIGNAKLKSSEMNKG